MKESYDVVIVGAGIAGLTQAILARKQGKRVLVCERDGRALGASIRNFGMVWPIGQPPGFLRDVALRSRELWMETLEAARLWHRPAGSLHLAYHGDELAVLEEFVAKGRPLGYDVGLLTPKEALSLSPNLRETGLKASMFSALEVCVDPRQVLSQLPSYMGEQLGIDFAFTTGIVEVESGRVRASELEVRAQEIFLCSGNDMETLFPEVFRRHEIVRCKLQMLRARPKDAGFRIGPHLCAGLTQLHYGNFAICDSVAQVRSRVELEAPEYLRHNIHLLVSQHENGDLTLGDSHEYGNSPTPFSDERIDELILRYLDGFLPNERYEVIQRWIGVYSKCKTDPFVVEEVLPGVVMVVGLGGTGMTMSFGIADIVQNKRYRTAHAIDQPVAMV